ncbi:MAG: tetratricopeptide repeat protein, partial [Nitrospirota bacterium]|nr:tetratricopeptide repeat protein [Nitrospirota bacterium]
MPKKIKTKAPKELDAAMRYFRAGDLRNAAAACRQILHQHPNHSGTLHLFGKVLFYSGQFDHAVQYFGRAVNIKPGDSGYLYDLGLAQLKSGRIDDTIKSFKRSLAIKPDYADAHVYLCKALLEKGMVDEAIEHCVRAIEAEPGYAEAYCNLGILHAYKGMFDIAIDYYKKALGLRPDYAFAHTNMALAYLAKGDLGKGWREYEWRLLEEAAPVQLDHLPRWDGSPLKDKTLFIYYEQGIGDEIMFASCLPDLSAAGGKYIMECDERLVPLFSRSFPGAMFIPHLKPGDEIPHADMKTAIGSLPLFFRPDLSSMPQQRSYLVPDETKAGMWRARFNGLGSGLKVGISWRGGAQERIKRIRSMSPEQWSGIFSIPGAHFINLQYGDCSQELKELRETRGVTIHDWEDADPLKDLDNFAAQIAALDLVISVDNSTVHMAGALGIPVWALLSEACDWRWMRDVEDTPWYRSVRLIREESEGGREGALERAAEILNEYVATGSLPGPDDSRSHRNIIRPSADKPAGVSYPIVHSSPDRTYRLAVITPVGPGHKKLYDECLASVNEACSRNKGRFSEILTIRVDDPDGALGRSAARNTGIRQAAEQGAQWLFFLDADDLLTARAFERMSCYLDNYDAVWGSIWTVEGMQQQAMERPGQLPFLFSI